MTYPLTQPKQYRNHQIIAKASQTKTLHILPCVCNEHICNCHVLTRAIAQLMFLHLISASQLFLYCITAMNLVELLINSTGQGGCIPTYYKIVTIFIFKWVVYTSKGSKKKVTGKLQGHNFKSSKSSSFHSKGLQIL